MALTIERSPAGAVRRAEAVGGAAAEEVAELPLGAANQPFVDRHAGQGQPF
jgi:hypothetical protein